MRHQDVRFHVVYQKRSINQRRGKPFAKIPKEQQDETNDLSNLLFTLHSTPVIDKLDLQVIAAETKKDETLSELINVIQCGRKWIPKMASGLLWKFQPILEEIMITLTGLLLKGDKIILPAKFQTVAIQLEHRGSHPHHADMERRLRSHFFNHDMQKKVDNFLQTCLDCPALSTKTHEPIVSHEVPSIY